MGTTVPFKNFKGMKKIKLFFVAMLMSAVAINSYGQAVGTTITYDGITYTFLNVTEGNLSVNVTGADATVTGDVVIPATIKDQEGNKDYKVTQISCDFGSNDISCLTLPENMTYIYRCAGTGIKKIKVSSTVNNVFEYGSGEYGFHGCTALEEFEVSADNPKYAHGACGELIKDGNALIQYPEGRTATSYTVPDGVTTISDIHAIRSSYLTDLSFGTTVSSVRAISVECPNVENVTIPASLTTLPSMTGLTGLQNYNVVEGHPVYSDIEGVLCSADKTELIGYPKGRTYADYSIPSSIVTVKESAFYGCKFNSLDFSTATSLEVIESTAFRGISYKSDNKTPVLETLDLSNTKLREIKGTYTFYADYIKKLILPETIKTIGDMAFTGNFIEEANFPEGLETIGVDAFSGNRLSTLHIPSTMTTFGDGAFKGNNTLTAITVAEGNPVFAASEGVLYTKDFTKLVFYPRGKADTEYVVDERCETIQGESMSSCKFEKITFPESLITIERQAFEGCKNLTEIVWPENCNLKTIAGHAFNGCTGLASFDLPASVEEINMFAFWGDVFTEFRIPDNSKLKKLDMVAFCHCDNLTTFTIGKNTELERITSVVSGEYYPGKNISTFIIEEGNTKLTTLDTECFKRIPSIETVTIAPDCGLTTLGTSCFEGCQHLTSLTLPAAVTTLGAKCFYNTPNLSDLVFTDTDEHPAHLETIGDNCFWLCGLTSFVVPRSVKTIARQAFHECHALETVSIPAGTTSVDKEAFYLCDELEAINVDKENATYASSDGIFCDKMKETLIIYPAGKATETFQLLPPSLTKIGPMSFFYSKNLKNVMIPKKVTEIDFSAFFGCTNLKDIVLLGDDPTAITLSSEGGEHPFTQVPTDATVWLRYDQQDKGITDWNGFKNFDYCKMSSDEDGNHQYEFFPMADGSANVLSVKNNTTDYTLVMPETVSDGQQEYTVDYLGDYMLEDAQENIKEVVVKHTPKYIGALAFNSAFGNADAFLCDDVDDMSTIRFEYDKETFNGRYNEGQNLYMKQSVAERVLADESWTDLADVVDYHIPLPAISTDLGTFSREFAVDLDAINPDKENPQVIAFTAGRPYYTKPNNLCTVHMVSINHTGEDENGSSGAGDGTYIPANTGVLLKAYAGSVASYDKNAEGEDKGAFYQIAEEQTEGYQGDNCMGSVTVKSKTIQPVEDGMKNFIISGGKLWSFTKPRNMTVHKAYLQVAEESVPEGANIVLTFSDPNSDDTDAITGTEVSTEADADGYIYNLQGQRVNGSAKGLYIKNGKKYIKK